MNRIVRPTPESTIRDLRALLAMKKHNYYNTPITLLDLAQELQKLIVRQGVQCTVRYVEDLQLFIGRWNPDHRVFDWFESETFFDSDEPLRMRLKFEKFIEKICRIIKEEGHGKA